MRSLRTEQDSTGTVRHCRRSLLLAYHGCSRPPTALPITRAVRLCHAHYRAALPLEFLGKNPPPIEVAVGAARGTPRTPFFEGSSPSPLAPSYASTAAADLPGAADVRAASASAKRCSSKGKGGRGGGGGSRGGGGGSSGGCGGSGGSGGSGSGGSCGGRTGAQRGVAIFDLDFDAILAAMYALSVSAEGDCYVCVPPDLGIEAAALGASESSLPSIVPAEALHTFTLDSSASRCFFHDSTTLTPLFAPVPVRLADPSGGPFVARSSTVPPCPGGSVWFTVRPSPPLVLYELGSSPYTLATEPPQVAASAQVSVSGQLAPPCSCRLLSQQTLLWHHRLGHPFLPRLRGMHSRLLVSGLPRSLPPLSPSPAPPCLPCVKGRQRAAPHSSSFPPTIASLQTLHMDVWGPACTPSLVSNSGEGTLHSFTLPESPQKNGIAERRIGLVMEYAAHQLNLWPHVSLPETTPTLHWTGKVGDALVFRVWGSRAFVRNTSADKLSARAIPCVFLGFSPDAPGWQPSSGTAPVEVAISAGTAPNTASGGAKPGGAERGGAESEGAGFGGAEPEGVESEGAGSGGAEPGSSEPAGVEPRGAEPTGVLRVLRHDCLPGRSLSPHSSCASGAAGAGDSTTGDTGTRGAGVTTGAGGTGGATAAGPGGACTGGTVVARTCGAGAGGAGAVDPGAGGAGATVRPRPYFVPLLQQVLGVPSSPVWSQPPLQPASPLPAPSPYTEQTGGLKERCEPASRRASPVRTSHRVPHPRPPPVPDTQAMALRLSSSDCTRAASPTVSHLLATVVTDPSFESIAASALVVELADIAATCRLDYATALVAESVSASPPSVGGECALGTDVLEDRQENFECLAATVPRFASMLLAPEGDLDVIV
ncbi:unnamed protein product [Closterium sp. NIES-53]